MCVVMLPYLAFAPVCAAYSLYLLFVSSFRVARVVFESFRAGSHVSGVRYDHVVFEYFRTKNQVFWSSKLVCGQ